MAKKTVNEPQTGRDYNFTWRTISTWHYRYKKLGITTLDNKTRSDKNQHRKVQVNELAEAINDVLPTMSKNKTGIFVKSTLYRLLIKNNFF